MTVQQFADFLEHLLSRAISEEPKTFKVGCQLPWELRDEVPALVALLSHRRLKVRVSALETFVEIVR